MKPLIILLGGFVTAFFASQFLSGRPDPLLSGRIAMAAMLTFTAIGHFAFRKGMAEMIPPQWPYKEETVLLTGVLELFGAAGLLIPGLVHISALLLILFFLIVLPANISAARRNIDYQTGDTAESGVSGTRYLWFRIPLQILFIGWTWFSAFGSF